MRARVQGRKWRRPLNWRRSMTPPMACMTLPAQRNSSALKNACVNTWKTAESGAPQPSATNMNANWLMVEYARMRFMSYWAIAIVAASTAPITPSTTITSSVSGECPKIGPQRATM